MLKRDKSGQLKRIEYRGRYLRASRTGGVAVRAQTEASGMNLTVNSSRGIRVSTRVARGTQVALQNGRFVLRGRYGKGPTKLNLSKSGASISTRTDFGTINWFKPGYSSAKLGGVQVRGKNALYLMLILVVLKTAYALLTLVAQALVLLLQVILWSGVWVFETVRERLQLSRERKLHEIELEWASRLKGLPVEQMESALRLIFLFIGAGKALDLSFDEPGQRSPDDKVERLVAELLNSSGVNRVLRLELLFGCLAELYEERVGEAGALNTFTELDQAAVRAGGRNELQERLLASYALATGIEMR